MDELFVKCLLYADNQVILALLACGLQEMTNKMNDSVKKKSMKVNVGKTKAYRPKMSEDRVDSYFETLPTEIVLEIFTYLSAKPLFRCRSVCRRWMCLIDTLTTNELLWRRHCKSDFGDIYKVARMKTVPGLPWFDLYKSMAWWSHLSKAAVIEDEFSSAAYPFQTNLSTIALHNGVIGVHTRSKIVYYDIKTLERANRDAVIGTYMRYQENYDTIVLLNGSLSLHIIRKLLYNPILESRAVFDNVKLFHLCDHKLFYVTINDQLFYCDLTCDRLTSVFLTRCPEEVLCLSYLDCLHILTFKQNIFKLPDKVLSLVSSINGDMLELLHRYQFLEQLDWRIFHMWTFGLNPASDVNTVVASLDVTVVRVYGKVVFVGTRWGIFQIYYEPYVNGVFDFFRSEPVKQWNFMERSDCPVLSHCPIINIEVLELENGHTVLVTMPKKVVVLHLRHEPKGSVSKAIIPYRTVPKETI
ncbi:hypothetical protein EVAR_43836_1 [Eumeta japonica]|uniref:F-box domain-containing protein n=1 Tax=Eumeta variegata TaxID=151549 RepID=A0A4C1WYR8_EUMVA|nr:hypothetical protein EVAR_43836_1 [Eumeta japonica]